MDDRIISDSLSFNDSIAEEKVNTKFLAACKNGTLYAVKPTEKNRLCTKYRLIFYCKGAVCAPAFHPPFYYADA